jgi:hypothetical protein
MTVTELQLDSMCVVRQIFAQSSPLVQYVQSCNSAGLPGRYAKEKLGLFLIAVLQSHNLVACGKARKIKKSDASNVRKSNSGRRNILMQPTAHTWMHFFLFFFAVQIAIDQHVQFGSLAVCVIVHSGGRYCPKHS